MLYFCIIINNKKKNMKLFNTKSFIFIIFIFSLTSCYTYTHVVGTGGKNGQEIKRANHYLLYGLAPLSVANPKEMAGEKTKDYTVTITHTFVDGLIAAITGGLYTPTTVIVTK